MSKIKIKYFGPIKEGYLEDDGWLDVRKVTVFIGNQGSGKSTITKLITTFMWIEKALTRGDYDVKWFTRKNKLRNQFLSYFRLENYFAESDDQSKAFIDYRGESFNISFENGLLHIEDAKNGDYPLPQIMYVPAERNFTSDIKNPKLIRLTSEAMIEFVSELSNALEDMKGFIRLPINDVDVEYNRQFDSIYIRGKVKEEPYRIKLSEASSGFQSVVPLYLVSNFLANSVKDQSDSTREAMTSEQRERFRKRFQEINETLNFTEEQKRIAISTLGKEFNKSAFINVVEEPEQNLFPTSQQKILNSLLEFNNMNKGNKLIVTTHSPYLINHLTLSVKASTLIDGIESEESRKKIQEIIPLNSTVNTNDLVVYEMNETEGSITKLGNYKGLPEDDNYLNNSIREINNEFDKLRQIEKNA